MKKVIAAGGLVFNTQQELLLIYRYGKWDLPKGHLEKGETLEQCALREVAEETGLEDLAISHTLGITEHTYFDKWLNSDAIKEVHWYTMITFSRTTFPQLQEGIEWIRWVAKDDLGSFLYSSYPNIREITLKAMGLQA